MSYRAAGRGLIIIAVLLTGSHAIAQSQDIQQSIPPIKTKSVDTDKSKHHTHKPQTASKPPLLPTNVIVSGELGAHRTDTEKSGDTEPNKWADMLFSFLLVVVGSVQAWFILLTFKANKLAAKATVRAARTARHTLRTMDDTAKRQLRAYVHAYVKEENLIEIAVGKEPHLTFRISNSGATPANKVVVDTQMEYREFPLVGSLAPIKREPESSVVVIHPHAEFSAFASLERTLTTDDVSSIKTSNAKRLYVYGRITYEDIFGEEHTTTFRLVTVDPVRITQNWPWIGTMYCKAGNDAD